MGQIVEICGVNTAKLKVLSQEEMQKLLEKAHRGDEEAKKALVEGNLRLVLSVIQRFDKRGENPDDLFQVGCIGLMKAVSNFDPGKCVRFSTYGVPTTIGLWSMPTSLCPRPRICGPRRKCWSSGWLPKRAIGPIAMVVSRASVWTPAPLRRI